MRVRFLTLIAFLFLTTQQLFATDQVISMQLIITPPDNSGTMGFYAPSSSIEYFFESTLVDTPVTGINPKIQNIYDTFIDPEYSIPTNPLENEIVISIRSLNAGDVASVQQTLSDIAANAPSFFIAWNALDFSLDGNIIAYDPTSDPVGAGMINLIRVALVEVSSHGRTIPYTLYNSGVSSFPGRTVMVEVEHSCPNVNLDNVTIEDVNFMPNSGPAIAARWIGGPIFADDNISSSLRTCRTVFEIQSFNAIGTLSFTWIDELQRIYYSARVNLGVVIGNTGTVIGNAGTGTDSVSSGNAANACGSIRTNGPLPHGGPFRIAFLLLTAFLLLIVSKKRVRINHCDNFRAPTLAKTPASNVV